MRAGGPAGDDQMFGWGKNRTKSEREQRNKTFAELFNRLTDKTSSRTRLTCNKFHSMFGGKVDTFYINQQRELAELGLKSLTEFEVEMLAREYVFKEITRLNEDGAAAKESDPYGYGLFKGFLLIGEILFATAPALCEIQLRGNIEKTSMLFILTFKDYIAPIVAMYSADPSYKHGQSAIGMRDACDEFLKEIDRYVTTR